MRETKRRRLEAKGWKVGTAGEFLGLSPAEEAYLELRLRLSDAIRKRRLRKRMTQTRLAKVLGSSQSRVAKMESGDSSVSLDLLVTSLFWLGTTRAELAGIISGRRRLPAA